MIPIHIDHTIVDYVGAGFKPALRTATHRFEEPERSIAFEH